MTTTLFLAALLLLALPTAAKESRDSFLLEDVYTAEGASTERTVTLKGQEVVEAWFNFTVRDDKVGSDPDSFQFTVRNLDDPSFTQGLPGTTDSQGRLSMPFHYTRRASPNWKVTVSCTQAGDEMFGPVVVEADPGNAWSLQVEYVYWTRDDPGNGNGNGGGGGGDDERPVLVSVFYANMVMVAAGGLAVAALGLRSFRRGGEDLRAPLMVSALLLVDVFLSFFFALLINVQENDAVLAAPPPSAAWLGNLALLLLLLWAAPFVLARRRVLRSEELHKLLARVTDERLANRMRRRGDRMAPDPVGARALAALLTVVGLGSVVCVALMLTL